MINLARAGDCIFCNLWKPFEIGNVKRLVTFSSSSLSFFQLKVQHKFTHPCPRLPQTCRPPPAQLFSGHIFAQVCLLNHTRMSMGAQTEKRLALKLPPMFWSRRDVCVCLVCRVLLCRGCNPRLSRVRRSLNPRAEESAQSLSRPGSPRAARRGCGAGHQPGDCAAAGREGGKVRTAKLPGTVTQPASRPTGRAKNAKTAAKQSRKTVQI